MKDLTMNDVLISVVMPVYNVEKYVAESIQSVLNQSYENFELIIVDDGGQDKSIDICHGFNDPRIKIISQKNRGLAGARNTGINAASGSYIAFLDSDDLWHKDKLSLHKIHLDSNRRIGVSYSGSRFIDENSAPLKQAQTPKLLNITAQHVFKRNPIGNGSAPVIRRDVLNLIAFRHPKESDRICYFDESFRQSEDIELWVRIALTSPFIFEGIDGLLTRYRIISGGLSANIVAQYQSWDRMHDKVKARFPEFISDHGPEARAYQLRYLSRRAVQLGDGAFALILIKEALQISITPLYKEPIKTLSTIAAAYISRYLPSSIVKSLIAGWTGRKSIA